MLLMHVPTYMMDELSTGCSPLPYIVLICIRSTSRYDYIKDPSMDDPILGSRILDPKMVDSGVWKKGSKKGQKGTIVHFSLFSPFPVWIRLLCYNLLEHRRDPKNPFMGSEASRPL